MHENDISGIIVDACFKIHSNLGPGLFESVYEKILEHDLESRNLNIKCQQPIPFIWNGIKFDQGFRADIIVENKVIIEVKSIESIAPVHQKQLLTYLRLTDIKLGLIVNFNCALIKDGIQRIVNNL